MSQIATRVYDFRLTLGGPDEFTVERANALHEGGCDDASFGTSNGVHFGTFHREADSLGEAIGSAIKAVERAGFAVVRVDVSD